MSALLLIVPLWPKFQFFTRTKPLPPTGNAGPGPCAGLAFVPPPMVSTVGTGVPPPLATVNDSGPASASLVNEPSPGGVFQPCAVRVTAPLGSVVVSMVVVAVV